MQQTLLALLAVAVFGYLALGRQEHERTVDTRAMRAQIELAAVDLARARLTAAEQGVFDEDDLAHDGIRTVPSTSTLGPDPGEVSPDDYDDIDDWDGFENEAEVEVGVGALRFEERVQVRYVEDLAPDTYAAGPTLTKEILVTVEQIQPDGTPVPDGRATLRRALTPTSVALSRPAP